MDKNGEVKVVKEEKKIDEQVGMIISEDRVLGFSDAVFAFAATLLVLKIDLPPVTSAQLATNFTAIFVPLWPQYVANIITFFVIGYYWLSHHAIFGMIKKYDGLIIWINIAFLICVSFLPFPVDLYGDNFLVRPVVIFYCASLAIVGYFLAGIWYYASKDHRLINSTMGDRQINYILARNLIAPVVFTLSIPLVYIHPIVAQLSWLVIIVGIYLLSKIYHVKGVTMMDKTSI